MKQTKTLENEAAATGLIVGIGIGTFVGLGILSGTVPTLIEYDFGTIGTIVLNSVGGGLLTAGLGFLFGLGLIDE